MNVLIACEFSGTVRDAFLRRGHNAWSCDLLPSESECEGGHHLEGDARWFLHEPAPLSGGRPWDLLIAHPPCTYLANSGVRWLYNSKGKNVKRWHAMRDGAAFFRELMSADIPRIAVENPIMHKYAVEIIGRRQDQIIQPWQFGHGETKATGLWLKNLPKLQATKIVSGRYARVHRAAPSADRWKLRSITYQGIADAMAEQWGNLAPLDK